MADITMCGNGVQCKQRETCYRFKAIPTERIQAYADFYEEGIECDMYWRKTEEEKERKRKIEVCRNCDDYFNDKEDIFSGDYCVYFQRYIELIFGCEKHKK